MTQPPTHLEQARLRALLERRAEAALGAATPPGEARSEPAPAPLTPAQARLWFLAQYEATAATYAVPVVLRLTGPLAADQLVSADRDVADRHAALRSVVRPDAGELVATPLPASTVPVVLTDSSPERLQDDLRRQLATPFALDVDPPLRAALLRLAADDHVLALTFHHIAVDDWSCELVLADLAACYAARVHGHELPPPPRLQHGDLARGELGRPADPAGVEWWATRLAGLAPLLELPSDLPRPSTADWSAGRVTVAIDRVLAGRVRAAAAATGCTPFMVLLAAWTVLLGRLSDHDDVVVGIAEAGRRQPHWEDVVGCFVNTLALRIDADGDHTGRELLAGTRDVVLDAFAHADVPFDQSRGSPRAQQRARTGGAGRSQRARRGPRTHTPRGRHGRSRRSALLDDAVRPHARPGRRGRRVRGRTRLPP